MSLLKYFGVALFNQFFSLLDLSALVWSEGLEVYLLKYFLFGNFDIIAHLLFVHLGGLTLERVSKVKCKQLFFEWLLSDPLVESLHMLESNSPLLVIVQEYFVVK